MKIPKKLLRKMLKQFAYWIPVGQMPKYQFKTYHKIAKLAGVK